MTTAGAPGTDAGGTVLVVDDLPQNVRLMDAVLSPRGYTVVAASSGVEALALLSGELPDIVLLDVMMPGLDGYETCRRIRSDPATSYLPVVMVTASGDAQRLRALEAGADDFVTKPFAMEELLARLRAVIRRHQQVTAGAEAGSVRLGSCDVDLVAHSVVRDGEPVRLTRTEWALLEILLRHPGQLVSTARLLAEVWGDSRTGEAGYLRFHMARLRRKLEDDPQNPRHLMTEYGTGYRFVP